jgi:beta-glucanase (GH16 family)
VAGPERAAIRLRRQLLHQASIHRYLPNQTRYRRQKEHRRRQRHQPKIVSLPLALSPRFLISSASEPPPPSGGPDGQDAEAYTLTFHDSFDGDLDRGAWDIDGAVSQSDRSNSTPNYAVSGGTLKIWPARGKNGEFFKRTLDTHGQFSQQYGYFEMEARLPKGKGVWPGFWMLGMSGERRPELDIMEAYPGGIEPWAAPDANGIPTSMMYGATLWRDAEDHAGFKMIATPDLSADFHRYGAKWEPNKVTYYFDGREVYSVDASLSDPMFLILSLWFGSASGQPDDSTPAGESNAYEISYVKAWQFR